MTHTHKVEQFLVLLEKKNILKGNRNCVHDDISLFFAYITNSKSNSESKNSRKEMKAIPMWPISAYVCGGYKN